MVRVTSEAYPQSIRIRLTSGAESVCPGIRRSLAALVRPVDQQPVSAKRVCPLGRPLGLRSSPRRVRAPIRATGGDSTADPSAPMSTSTAPPEVARTPGSRNRDVCGFRKPHGVTAPPLVGTKHGAACASPWPTPAAGTTVPRGNPWKRNEPDPVAAARRLMAGAIRQISAAGGWRQCHN